MNQASKTFLSATASLALILAGCADAKAGSGAKPLPSSDSAPAALATILRDYNTAASEHLKTLAADFNAHLPSGVSPIVYLDYDKIATWFGLSDGPSTVEKAIGDYLMATTGRTYDPLTLSLLAEAMNSLDAEGIVMQKAAGSCLVVPEYPGISFDSAYAATFRLGPTDLLAGKTVTIDLSTKQVADFVDAHESWHCLDIRYVRDTGDDLEGAVKRNRAEMFADIGGAMEAVRDGAGLALIDKLAALHAAWAFLTGPAHAKTPPESEKHFASIVYATQGGLFALQARIEKMGLASFRKLDRQQLRALDYQITDADCLTYAQAQALEAYFATGAAQAPARSLITTMRAIAEASVRDATPAELAAREKSVTDVPNDDGPAQQALLQRLQARARELGGAASFANQLKARQEMTDTLRAKLLGERDPSAERATEAQLKLLLYTDPRLVPRKNGIRHVATGDPSGEWRVR
jgi:hypothetical protein